MFRRTNHRLSPSALLSLAVASSLALAAVMLGLAMDQRWLGLRLTTAPNLAVPVQFEGLWIEAVAATGPAAEALPTGTGETVFATVVAIVTPEGERFAIEPGDLLEEPDTLPLYDDIQAFFDRQTEIAALLASPLLLLETRPYFGEATRIEIRPAAQRPAASLPPPFWMQIAVGLAGFWIGAWVWALQRGEWAARCLFIAGTGLMISAFPAAVYSTRELAIPGDLFMLLSGFNHAGALTFGVGMIGLFLVYPRRLVANGWLALPALVLGAWLAVGQLRLTGGPPTGFHAGVVLAMLAIVVLVAIQFRLTRRDPLARAALRWLGLSVAVGAGAFVITTIAPNLFGLPPVLSQGVAFLFFLLIYVGVALGVARFRLFQLDEWAFRILFYVVGALLLLALDALLIVTIVNDRVPAFALSLLVVALLWLPLREELARRVLRRRDPARENLFRAVMDVALTPPERDQDARWRALLDQVFQPLSTSPAPEAAAPALVGEGIALDVPGAPGLSGYRLHHAASGRRLFSLRDRDLAAEISAMLGYALESRAAYERGALEERGRIARDIHDNIGVQLMAALHSGDKERKDVMIRETLTDLRDIINNASGPELPFDELLADLRSQISEHLHGAGVEMVWEARRDGEGEVSITAAHALRSILREAVRNALRHGAPGRVSITVRLSGGRLALEVADDGAGFDAQATAPGNGLSNMRARAMSLGGRFEIAGGPEGTRVEAEIPAQPAGRAA